MYLIADGQHLLQILHLVHHLRSQAQLVGTFLGCNREVNGIKPVDAVITLWGSLHMSHADQFIQPEQFAAGSGHGNSRSIKARGTAFGHQSQTNPPAPCLVIAHIVCPQKFAAIVVLHGPGNVVHRDAQTAQLLAVILQLPLHGRGAGHLHLVHTVQPGQARLDVLFGITLNKNGGRRRIEGKRQERPLCLLVRHLHLDHRIRNPVGQFGPSLAHNS